MREHSDLRQKIEEAKRRLSLPELLSRLGLGEHATKTARCPFPGHVDKHPSFSVFKGKDGFWHYKCFVCDPSGGDEITFLVKHFKISRREAIKRYLEMAGFPASRPTKSREYPKCLGSPVSPECPVSPVYNGQDMDTELEKELKTLAMDNACTCAEDIAETKRFKLARDLRGLQKKIGKKLATTAVRVASDEWERISLPCLDWNGDDHFTMLLAEVTKVRVPTGEGDTFNKALEAALKIPDADLPVIPVYPDARKAMRKLAALHREMSHLRDGKVYFLSYRDAAKVYDELSPSSAHTITLALECFGVIKIVSKGQPSPHSRKAAEFCYLLRIATSGNESITHVAASRL